MKLIRHGQAGSEKPGIVDSQGVRRDVSALISDWNGTTLSDGSIQRIKEMQHADLPSVSDDVRWAAPVARPGKCICIGLNYSDHAAEAGMDIPKEPIIFFKASNTVVGPYDPVQIPRNSEKTDWEVELGVIIGKATRYLNDESEAKDCIAGYVISHDVSERAFQLERGGQWVKGKSCDTFNPLGPWLVTPDEIADPQNLDMSLDVNGQRMQTGNTSTMVFNVPYLVHYLSQFMTLEAGDLISTGTPPGVGLGMKPPKYLAPGDVVDLAIDQLGTQRQLVIGHNHE